MGLQNPVSLSEVIDKMTPPTISVVIATRNPDSERLREVLAALFQQDLPVKQSEICVVDNGSDPPLRSGDFEESAKLRVVREERPGLLAARLCGLAHTKGHYIVFIDDDTVANHHFLKAAVAFMEAHPQVGVAGGKIVPRYIGQPPEWMEAFTWALALRDNGPHVLEWNLSSGTNLPSWTPIGAGLLVRRAAVEPNYLLHVQTHESQIERISWRGQGVGGVEDKDMVLHCLRAGWSIGYSPEMMITHIIPPSRMEFAYFVRILPALGKMWAQTLHAHGFEIYPPIHPWSLPLRKLKAWILFRAWRCPANKLRWLESCGYLDGLAANCHAIRYVSTQSA